MNNVVSTALSYVSEGLAVFPVQGINSNGRCLCRAGEACENPGKHPSVEGGCNSATIDPKLVEQWFTQRKNPNIGIATGSKWGYFALDVDVKSDGPANLATIEAERGTLPETVEEITGGGGRHKFFRTKGKPVQNSTSKIAPGIDIRGDGGYVVVAPSLHASGRQYEWVKGHAPGEIEMAEAPEWLMELVQGGHSGASSPLPGKRSQTMVSELADGRIPEGTRNDSLFKSGCRLRRLGCDEQEILEALQAINLAQCSPPLEEGDIEKIAASIARYDIIRPCTDAGNAERLVDQFGEKIRYVTDSRRWLIYDGRRWARRPQTEIIKFAMETVRMILAEIDHVPGDLQKEHAKWAKKSEAKDKLTAMVDLAKSDTRIAVDEAAFDTNPMLFNVENGVIDLKTGLLHPHHPDFLLSKIANVKYDPDAKCPIWDKAMSTWMSVNKALERYMQRAFGYMLTGSIQEQCVFLAYGTGANGKSVAVNTVMGILGDYAIQTPVETIMVKSGGGIPNDVARLKGQRMVVAMEGESGQKLAESLVKGMSGGDVLTARFLYGEYFDFRPQLKLVIVTNHKPIIHGQDHGIWRRINLVPFETTIPESERDLKLNEKLESEKSGILNWLVQGCLAWQKDGLNPPEVMQKAKTLYQEEMDPIGNFIVESCYRDEKRRECGSILYDRYQEWAKDSGEKAISRRLFYRRLREKGFSDRNSSKNGGMEFYGISLMPPMQGMERPILQVAK